MKWLLLARLAAVKRLGAGAREHGARVRHTEPLWESGHWIKG